MYSSIYRVQSSTRRLPIRALFGFMLKLVGSYLSPSPVWWFVLGVNLGLPQAGWIAVCTTALCLQFDSPTLGPCFPIPRPIVLLLGHVTLHWVALHCIGSHHIASGQVTSHRVRSVALLSGCIVLHWVASHCIGLCHIALGCVASHWVGSVALLSTLIGALSLPAVIPLLCTLFPTAPCKGLTFTYMFPYLAPVIAALGACP